MAESSDRKVDSQRVSTAPLTGCVTLAAKVQELENESKEELKAENKELKVKELNYKFLLLEERISNLMSHKTVL